MEGLPNRPYSSSGWMFDRFEAMREAKSSSQ